MLRDLRPDHEPSLPSGAYQQAVRDGGRRRRLRRNRIATGGVVGLVLTGMLLVGNPFEFEPPASGIVPADMPAWPVDPVPSSVPGRAVGDGVPMPLPYVPIAEPFATPGPCNVKGTPAEAAACELLVVLAVDQDVDELQRERFLAAADEGEQSDLAEDDRTWLTHRTKFCAAEAGGGEADDELRVARCLLASSQARRVELREAG